MPGPAEQRWLTQQGHPARRALRRAVGAGLLATLATAIYTAGLAAALTTLLWPTAAPVDLLPALAIAVVGLLGRAAAQFWQSNAGFAASQQVRHALRTALFSQLAVQGPIASRSTANGAWTTALVDQVDGVDGYFSRFVPQQTLAGLVPLLLMTLLTALYWPVGVWLWLTVPLLPLAMAYFGIRTGQASAAQWQAMTRLNGRLLDAIQGLGTLKLWHQSQAEGTQLAHRADALRRATMTVLRQAFLSGAALELLSTLGIAGGAVCLAWGLFAATAPWPAVTPFVAMWSLLLLPEVYQPLRLLGVYYHGKADALGAAHELMPLLTTPPAVASDPAPLPPPPYTIALQHLSFGYDAHRPLLRDLNGVIGAGQRVVLFGPSGAGKTTLLNLLLQFALPQTGNIAVNGTALADLDAAAWRQQIAWIGQQPHLVAGSLRDNLALGQPTATPAQVEDAARRARVWEFAQTLPQGLDTPLAERGANLSGGQIQRIAIARALLKNAPIWCLDEPTAHLDADNAQPLTQLLDEVTRGRTVLWLTHDPALAALADQVWTLDQGQLQCRERAAPSSPSDPVAALKAVVHG